MNAVSLVLFILTSLGAVYYILSALALVSRFRRPSLQPLTLNIQRPSVSILKPISGLDAGAGKSFLSYLSQDYDEYEVIFGVLDEDDAAVPLLGEIVEQFANASLHIGSEIRGANNKVRILHNLSKHATGEVLVITDADTRVTSDFLARITAPFDDSLVGVVTCLYRGADARGAADALEGLHMTCVFAPGVACAEYLSGLDFGLGAAIAIRRSVLDRIGGFEPIADYLADDFQLGRRAALIGYDVKLSDYVVDVVLSGEGLGGVLARELRWSKTTRVSRPWGHFGLIFTFGFAYSLLFLLASGFSPLGKAVLGGMTAIRGITALIGMRCTGDFHVCRISLLPLRDLLSFAVWVGGYISRTITWRGRRLRLLRDGRITAGP